MALSLIEQQRIGHLASAMYDLLPGKAHPYADQDISYAGIARALGLDGFWQGGSKLPAITKLLELTLEHRRDRFCPLIVEAIRRAVKYRAGKRDPLAREDVTLINSLVAEISFKIPELWNPAFLDALPRRKPAVKAAPAQSRAGDLARIKSQLVTLDQVASPKRGLAFEKLLNDLFAVCDLSPREAFRLRGEQIDGSFDLGGDTYLLEAKWHKEEVDLGPLLVFDGKVRGKTTWSRGTFVSYGGFTEGAIGAYGRGRPASFIGFNGSDLYCILDGRIRLEEAIQMKSRRAVETGMFMAGLEVMLREVGR